MILVLKPKEKETGVYEVDFSFKFCSKYLKKSLSLLKENYQIIEYEDPISVPIKNEVKYILFFQKTDVLVSSFTIKALLEVLTPERNLAVPLFNDTPVKEQQVFMPFIYHDIPSFYEFTEFIYKNGSCGHSIEKADKTLCAIYGPDFEKVFNKEAAFVCCKAYAHKFEKYYESPREDLISLIPDGVSTILDIGCAKGGFGKRLKEIRPDVRIYGVEMNPVLAREAAKHYDEIWVGKFEDIDFPMQFDLINLGDVLEHMYNPWDALYKAKKLIRTEGFITGSIPNICHWSIIKGLLSGRFEYIPVGLLCISHIRFFSRKSFLEMVENVGLSIDILKLLKDKPTPSGREIIKLSHIYLGASTEDLETVEIIFRLRK